MEDQSINPFGSRKNPVIDLTPGQRISIAGRKGTFVLYYKTSASNFIQWLPDNNNLESEDAIWSGNGIIISEWDEKDSLSQEEIDFALWKDEL